jgi:PAS domain S-box-containing protein
MTGKDDRPEPAAVLCGRDQDSLRESEELHRTILQTAMDGFWLVDTEGRLLEVNETYCRMSGFSVQELLTMRVPDLEAAEAVDDIAAHIQKVIAEGEDRFESRHRRKDGTIYDVEVSVHCDSIEGGRLVVFLRDITERKQLDKSLRLNLTKYTVLFDSFPLGISVTDAQGNILEANRESARLLGLSAEEQTRRQIDGAEWQSIRPDGSLMPPGQFASVRALEEQRLVGNVEMGIVRPGGDVKWLSVSAAPLPLEGYGVIVTYGDVSSRKQAEDALRESEERYRSLFEHMLEGFAYCRMLYDKDNRPIDFIYLVVNPAFNRIVGTSVVVGRPVTEAFPGIKESFPELFEIYGRVAGTGEPESFDLDFRPVDKWLHISVYSPAREYFVAMLQDITERKRVDLALRESEQRFRFVVHSTTAGYFRLDVEGRWEDVNNAWLAIHGYQDRSEVIGRPFTLTQVDVDMPAAMDLRRRLANGASVPSGQFTHRKKDGTMGYHTYSVVPVVREGQVVGTEGFMIDITDLRHTEAALKTSEERFLQAQKMEAVGRLAGGVAHDFNNMLTAILGYSDYLLQGLPEDAPLRGPLSEIRKAGQRAASLTRQLLAFSRKQVLSPTVLDVGQVVVDVEKMVSRVIGEHITVVCANAPEQLFVEADRGQLEQVLLNLAVNAGDAMPGGGRLRFETRRATLDEAFAQAHLDVKPGDYVEIAVTDTGTGMTPEILSHLFEPFFTTKAPGKGTGLGLSTVYGIVKQSNGHVVVESAMGRGSTFSVYLPSVAGRPETGAVETRTRVTHRRAGTVLLAEDDDAVRSLTKLVLQELGYQVFEARDGAEACGLFDAIGAELDLLVTDIVMPAMGGHVLADRLKQRRPGLKVLYISGYADEAITRLSALPPGSVFLEKPFGPEDFVEKLREVLGGGPAWPRDTQ